MVFVPHRMMYRLLARSSGRNPGPSPIVMAIPVPPALPQTERTRCVAPSRAKNASLMALPCSRPWVPR